MAIFPVLIRVESPALGDVLQTIHKFPGIVDFQILFDDVPAPRGGSRKRINGSPTGHAEEKPQISTRIIAALAEHGPLHLKQLVSLLGDVPQQSISGTLTAMKQSGITEQQGMGVHALTKEALAKMGAKPKDAVLAMPKPDNKGQGADVILERLKEGPAKRSELSGLLVTHHLAASSIQHTLNKMIERGDVETIERGVYQLKAPAEAEPAAPAAPEAAPKKQKSTDIIIDFFKAHEGRAGRAAVRQGTGLSERVVDGVLTRLKQKKVVESAGEGVYRFTKDAAKKLQTAASKE